MEWNRKNTGLLIQLFKEKRELWDITCVEFKDRNKKQDAWKDLGNKMNLDKYVVEKKMRSLIGQFQRELKRVKSAGETSSKWFGFQKLRFLEDKSKIQSTKKDVSKDNFQDFFGIANVKQTAPMKKIKKIVEVPDSHVEMYDTSKESTERKSRHSRDDLNIFGEYITSKLRNLRDPFVISTVQNQINNIIYQAEISMCGAGSSYKYNTNCYTVTNPDPFRSPQTSSLGLIDSEDEKEDMDDILTSMQHSKD